MIIFYLRETDEMKSTIFCRVRSGSSPGISVAKAMAAERRATKAPSTPNQSILRSAVMISIPVLGMSKAVENQRPSLREMTVPKAEAAAVTITHASHSLVLREWASASSAVT